MAYTFDEPKLGLLAIAYVDSGQPTANSGTTVYPTLPNKPGMVVRAFDPVYGEGEFILLKGVANTAVGSVVTYNGTTYNTTLAATTKNQARPVAFAMAANTATSNWAWYQIGGTVVAKKGTARLQPNVAVGVSTAGVVGNTNSGIEILGARSSNAATALTAATTVLLIVDRPHLQGRIT